MCVDAVLQRKADSGPVVQATALARHSPAREAEAVTTASTHKRAKPAKATGADESAKAAAATQRPMLQVARHACGDGPNAPLPPPQAAPILQDAAGAAPLQLDAFHIPRKKPSALAAMPPPPPRRPPQPSDVPRLATTNGSEVGGSTAKRRGRKATERRSAGQETRADNGYYVGRSRRFRPGDRVVL
uniref:Uncharacterized protein n=1 Tax=Pyramimonas obovata TaxID=1411642 RepID=A0A7S0RD31_9CHLO